MAVSRGDVRERNNCDSNQDTLKVAERRTVISGRAASRSTRGGIIPGRETTLPCGRQK